MPSEPLAPVTDFLQRIPLSARSILDVACGRGDLLAAYRLMNPTARLMGIETDPTLANLAKQHLTDVAVVDVEADPMPFDVPGGLDCIIYSTSLEHMRDPWALLRRHAELLTPDGMMLICLPNMEHWSFAERLLRGNWDYQTSGLLDRSHLRWFSLESTRRALTDAGLTLCDIHPRIFDLEQSERFATAMEPALTALGIDPVAYKRRAAALQYVWRVRREPRQRMMVAGNMLAPVGGVSHVRVVHPLQAMGTDPMVEVRLTDRLLSNQPDDGRARIFVLHRPDMSGAEGRRMLKAIRDAGWLVVTEFDDHPDFMRGMENSEQLGFYGVHAIQTSTRPLAEVLRARNPEIAIFPNALVSLPPITNFADPRSLTLFFGALNREPDWRHLVPAINEVAAKVGARLKFQVVHDRGFYEALESPHKNFTPTCDYETYMKLLGRSEISFMPLDDNGFNRAKSDLKFIEAGACRVAPLASSVVYAGSIVHNRTGMLFRDVAEFRTHLMNLVAMPDMARQIGDAARRYVTEERMLAYQVEPRIAWYRSLWERRESLTAALEARMAALDAQAAA
jgi:SAM-dependent methyltransferase